MIDRVRILFTWLFSIVALTLVFVVNHVLPLCQPYELKEQEKSLHEELGDLEKLFEESNEKVLNPIVLLLIVSYIAFEEICMIEYMLSGKRNACQKFTVLVLITRYCFMRVSTPCCPHGC